MKVQLLLLGAVAMLTAGALRLADQVPAASISAPAAAAVSVQENAPGPSLKPAAEPAAAPVTIVDAAPTPPPTPIAAAVRVTASSSEPGPAAGIVGCGNLSQVVQSVKKKRGIERPAIATVCADLLPGASTGGGGD